MSLKPALVSHFLHTGPALSDFNSVTSVITNPVTIHPSSSLSSSTRSNQPGSAVTRVVSGVPLPPPVACSPFSKTENAKIALAWKILNAQSSSLTPSNLDASTCSSGPVSEVMSDLSPPRSQTQTVQSSDSELDTISPKRGSKSDLKGKGKLIAKQSKSGDDDEEASSFKSSLPQSENIGSEEFKSQDGVLNLSLEDEFYIVPVGLDSLFTVDVRRLKLYPAFWHGPQLDVYRGQWFYPSTNKHKFYPCEPELAEALEAAYDQIRPWDLSYEDELRSALKIGTEAEDKLKVHLKKFDHDVIFQTASQVYLKKPLVIAAGQLSSVVGIRPKFGVVWRLKMIKFLWKSIKMAPHLEMRTRLSMKLVDSIRRPICFKRKIWKIHMPKYPS